jgi:aminoglycoside phosphotransferase family enzyme/predicted kinase
VRKEPLSKELKFRQPTLIRDLMKPAAYPHPVERVRLVETHISWVLLTGSYAYKIKKPVNLGFLDFSSLEDRRHFCEEEVRINRRTTAELYLGVVPVGRTPDGPRFGVEPPVEFAVRMRQFPHEARLDRCLQAGRLDFENTRRLAQSIARFHMSLPPRLDSDPEFEVERAVRPARNNFKHLNPQAFGDEAQQQLAVIEAWTLAQASALAPVFEARARSGAVRECHGDLHLENLLMLDGRFVPYDAIEFNPNLRWIDIANDIAFLAMDLLARGHSELAFLLLGAWLEANGDYHSLEVMRFFLVYRSIVRAVVSAIRSGQAVKTVAGSARPRAERYIQIAADLVDTPTPRLILMHGFSGSGKTWFSNRLAPGVSAIRVRSDLERKRPKACTGGESKSEGVGLGMYGADEVDRTYRSLADHCRTGLQAGFNMVADATFLQKRHRQWFVDLARSLGSQCWLLDCTAPEEVLRDRIRRRAETRDDASDADQAVLEHQLSHFDPVSEAEGLSVVTLQHDSDPGQVLRDILERWDIT